MDITRADLRDRILQRLENNYGFYEEAEIDRAINDSIRILNAVTGLLQSSYNISGNSVAGQAVYTVPSAILVPLAVYFDNEPLSKTDLRSLSLDRPEWRMETTATLGAQVSRWVPLGLNRFAIWPADAVGGHTIRVDGLQEPSFTDLADEVLPIHAEHAEVIEGHAFHTLTVKEGGKIFLDSTLKVFRQQYRQKIQSLQIWADELMPYLRVQVKAEKA